MSGDGFRYEAMELRDGDKGVYLGNSVKRAVNNINEKISEALIGMDPILQAQIDQAMIDLDKTEKKVPAFFIRNGLLLGVLPEAEHSSLHYWQEDVHCETMHFESRDITIISC